MRASLLLVDDEPSNLLILHSYIEDSFSGEINVTKAMSGNEAVINLSLSTFDLIISDLNMPEGDGHFVLNYITHSKISTPVIIWTAEDRSEYARLIEAGAHKVFSKLTDMKSLIQEIRHVLDEIKNV